ncbi:hypothetical protein [Verrucosispora sp. NA02020]|uniref:hypothetical protein n=1 Tax=Verrucosispora sp. NA02020 TaxID=2742132 RepID=UPI001590606E|nr:hypothetical protein [Verrucosispora sp. NA02020]QKW15482.1 hypothetical protein HUT12_23725 [Verrucosispora sp. NA02020]
MDLAAKQQLHIENLLHERAIATPPRGMAAAATIAAILTTFDMAAFTIHAFTSRHRPGMGVALGVHAMTFGVLVLVTVALIVGYLRVRGDLARTTAQDQIDAYRHDLIVKAIRDAVAAQPDIITQAVKQIMADRDRADRQRFWAGQAETERTAWGIHPDRDDGNDGSVIPLPQRPGRRTS